jgi:exonuclease III
MYISLQANVYISAPAHTQENIPPLTQGPSPSTPLINDRTTSSILFIHANHPINDNVPHDALHTQSRSIIISPHPTSIATHTHAQATRPTANTHTDISILLFIEGRYTVTQTALDACVHTLRTALPGPASAYRLTHGGRTLQDTHTLQHYGLDNGDTIRASLPGLGGTGHTTPPNPSPHTHTYQHAQDPVLLAQDTIPPTPPLGTTNPPESVPITRPTTHPSTLPEAPLTGGDTGWTRDGRHPHPERYLPVMVALQTGAADRIEAALAITTEWQQIQPLSTLATYITSATHGWDSGVAYTMDKCTTCQSIRYVTLHDTSALIRYLTPYHIWTIRITILENQPNIDYMEPIPTPTELQHTLYLTFPSPQQAQHTMEVMLHLHRLLQQGKTTQIVCFTTPPMFTAQDNLEGVTASYACTASTPQGTCILCNNEHATALKLTCTQPHKLSLRCARSANQNIYRSVRIPLYLAALLTPPTVVHPHQDQTDQVETETLLCSSPPLGTHNTVPFTNRPNPTQATHTTAPKAAIHSLFTPKPKNPNNTNTPSRAHTSNTISIISWNGGSKLTQAFGALLNHCTEQKIDIICLQETEGLGLLDDEIRSQGYNIYRHTKVAILLAVDTAERIHISQYLWRSDNYDSMFIVLGTHQGRVAIGTTYLPSGVDYLSKANLKGAVAQHSELNAMTSKFEHSILTMDANETTDPEGRIHATLASVTNPDPDPHQPTTSADICKHKLLHTSTMACYLQNMRHMQVTDRTINPHSYTHQQTSQDKTKTIYSAIDYIWISKSLIHKTEEFTILPQTRLWSKQPAVEYHRALQTRLQWPDIWQSSQHPPGTPIPLASSDAQPLDLSV